jgi:hypothetical protein
MFTILSRSVSRTRSRCNVISYRSQLLRKASLFLLDYRRYCERVRSRQESFSRLARHVNHEARIRTSTLVSVSG